MPSTLVQIIPQAICSRYGLAVGANFVWLVRILMIICYPISYPIGKVCILAVNHKFTLPLRRKMNRNIVVFPFYKCDKVMRSSFSFQCLLWFCTFHYLGKPNDLVAIQWLFRVTDSKFCWKLSVVVFRTKWYLVERFLDIYLSIWFIIS